MTLCLHSLEKDMTPRFLSPENYIILSLLSPKNDMTNSLLNEDNNMTLNLLVKSKT